MDPATLALIAAAIQSLGEIVDQLSKGTITNTQAQEYLQGAAMHYRQSVAKWSAK